MRRRGGDSARQNVMPIERKADKSSAAAENEETGDAEGQERGYR